jgi:hypothetical protein
VAASYIRHLHSAAQFLCVYICIHANKPCRSNLCPCVDTTNEYLLSAVVKLRINPSGAGDVTQAIVGCLSVPSFGNGVQTTLESCDSTDGPSAGYQQLSVREPLSPLKPVPIFIVDPSNGKSYCLEVTYGYRTSLSRVGIVECNINRIPLDHQLWYLDYEKRLRPKHAKHMCVDWGEGRPAGRQLYIYLCKPGEAVQSIDWEPILIGPIRPTPAAGELTAIGGRWEHCSCNNAPVANPTMPCMGHTLRAFHALAICLHSDH